MSHYKPYPAYKPSHVDWIGDVPEHWELKRLRHVATFNNSSVDKKSYEDQKEVKLCNYKDVYYNEFITSALDFMVATASDAEIEKFSLKKGDVIITKDSEDPKDIGIPALVLEDMDDVICGYHLTVIKTHDNELAGFIHRSIEAHSTRAYFFVESPGITRFGLNQDAIGNIPVCVPPKEVCIALTKIINQETSRIDTLIAKKTRFIELLKEKRQALITHLVTKGLNPDVLMKDSDIEWIGQVPVHWSVIPIKRIASLKTVRTNESSIEVQYVGLEDVQSASGKYMPTEGNARQSEDSTVAVFSKGDVLYGKLRPYLKKAIVAKMDGVCSTEFLVLDTHKVEPELLQNWLLTSDVTQQIESTCEGAKMPRAGWEGVGSVPIPVPPNEEQSKLVEAINAETTRIDTLIAKTQHSIELLKERRSAFITAAVTGQIDVRNHTNMELV